MLEKWTRADSWEHLWKHRHSRFYCDGFIQHLKRAYETNRAQITIWARRSPVTMFDSQSVILFSDNPRFSPSGSKENKLWEAVIMVPRRHLTNKTDPHLKILVNKGQQHESPERERKQKGPEEQRQEKLPRAHLKWSLINWTAGTPKCAFRWRAGGCRSRSSRYHEEELELCCWSFIYRTLYFCTCVWWLALSEETPLLWMSASINEDKQENQHSENVGLISGHNY